jgi:hypothetical protein
VAYLPSFHCVQQHAVLRPKVCEQADRLALVSGLMAVPKEPLGILDSYAVVPLHQIVFGGMLNGIKRAAESSYVSKETERHHSPEVVSQCEMNSDPSLWSPEVSSHLELSHHRGVMLTSPRSTRN